MEWSKRIITQLPLAQLWTGEGPVGASRGRTVGEAELAALLRRGPLRFVVADVGKAPHWRTEADCFAFWKSEVRPRLVRADATSWRLEDYPGEYCYRASEWTGAPGTPIVVLEACH